jgi:ribonuclease HI
MICLYIDGSHYDSHKASGIGVVALNTETRGIEAAFGLPLPRWFGVLYNKPTEVAEYAAAVAGLTWCLANRHSNVLVLHDLNIVDVKKHAALRKQHGCRMSYSTWMWSVMTQINVQFLKIDAHTGNKLNDAADALAKQGARMAFRDADMIAVYGRTLPVNALPRKHKNTPEINLFHEYARTYGPNIRNIVHRAGGYC